ncbi:hypothetical protein ACFLU6_01560 [Acidobacteriota bacterium]
MSIRNKKKFALGAILFVAFVVVLVFIFMPVIGGRNFLEYSDALYNSISKYSAYFIPELKEKVSKQTGKDIEVTLEVGDALKAEETARLFSTGEARVEVSGTAITVRGDLGAILTNCLDDADAMYRNEGAQVSGKYAFDERHVLYSWWIALKEMDKDLKKQKKFAEAELVTTVKKKAVESSYNYYGIEPRKITESIGIVIFSLIFYVIYTVWYGFAILFLFEGWGLRLEH